MVQCCCACLARGGHGSSRCGPVSNSQCCGHRAGGGGNPSKSASFLLVARVFLGLCLGRDQRSQGCREGSRLNRVCLSLSRSQGVLIAWPAVVIAGHLPAAHGAPTLSTANQTREVPGAEAPRCEGGPCWGQLVPGILVCLLALVTSASLAKGLLSRAHGKREVSRLSSPPPSRLFPKQAEFL